MSDIPAAGVLSNPLIVESDHQAAMDDLVDGVRELLGGSAVQALTIASGVVTPAVGASLVLSIDTEGGAASDDLTHVALTNVRTGALVLLRAADTNRTVVLKHGVVGSGQLLTHDAADFALDDTSKALLVVVVGTSLVEVLRSWGNDDASARTALGLGTAALATVGTGSGDVPTNADIFATVRSYTRSQYFSQATLTDAVTISWDLDLAQCATVTLSGNRTLGAPTNQHAGATYVLLVKQDGTGGRTLAYHATYKWKNGTAPVVAAAAGKATLLSFYSDGTNMYGLDASPFL